jgi:hypothetical protein
MSIAFLLLTRNDHLHINKISSFLKNGNIYVHPKYPNQVKSFLKNYIINDLVETKWGKLSIVNAEYNLLKTAFNNTNNKWFILMSESCYPLISYNKLLKEINVKNKSHIFLTTYFTLDNMNFFKASQFWILKRDDVEIILKYYNKYYNLFLKYNSKIRVGVPDETFFITLLMNEIKDYDFINIKLTFTRWLYVTHTLHPFVFNKLTKMDKKYIKNDNSYFIRKTGISFDLNTYKNKNNLIIYYIDNLSNKNIKNMENIINNNDTDYIIFYSDYAKIPRHIIERSIYMINIYYKNEDISIKLFKILYQEVLSQWKNIKYIKYL